MSTLDDMCEDAGTSSASQARLLAQTASALSRHLALLPCARFVPAKRMTDKNTEVRRHFVTGRNPSPQGKNQSLDRVQVGWSSELWLGRAGLLVWVGWMSGRSQERQDSGGGAQRLTRADVEAGHQSHLPSVGSAAVSEDPGLNSTPTHPRFLHPSPATHPLRFRIRPEAMGFRDMTLCIVIGVKNEAMPWIMERLPWEAQSKPKMPDTRSAGK